MIADRRSITFVVRHQAALRTCWSFDSNSTALLSHNQRRNDYVCWLQSNIHMFMFISRSRVQPLCAATAICQPARRSHCVAAGYYYLFNLIKTHA